MKDDIDATLHNNDTGEAQMVLFKDIDTGVEFEISAIDVFVRENWGVNGVAPYFVEKWLRLGWEHNDIMDMMNFYVGPDWMDHKVSYWIDKMIEAGVHFPESKELFAPHGESACDVMAALICKTIMEGFTV